MRRPFAVLGIVVFLAIAALEVARLALGWTASAGGIEVPPLASMVTAAVALALALGLWLEMRRKPGAAVPAVAKTRSATRSAARTSPSGPAHDGWFDPETGQRRPAGYFMFNANIVPVDAIRSAAGKYGRIMVGYDQGALGDPGATESLRAAREVGAELEIYVEGPGGPTGDASRPHDIDTWAPDEKARVIAAAKSLGIDTSRRDWLKEEWFTWGWKEHTFRQLEQFFKREFSAAEIDNLYQALGDNPSEAEAYVAFYKEYAKRHAEGRLPRLVLKNHSLAQLKAIVAAVKRAELPRAMFSEWHILETEKGNQAKAEDRISSQIAIRTIVSWDTYNYAAKGEYNLEKQFARMLPVKPPAAPVAAAPPAPVMVAAALPAPVQAAAAKPAAQASAPVLQAVQALEDDDLPRLADEDVLRGLPPEPDDPEVFRSTVRRTAARPPAEIVKLRIEQEESRYYATDQFGDRCYVGKAMSYAIQNARGLGLYDKRQLYDRFQEEKRTGLWAHFIWPSVMAESQGMQIVLNTWDRAHFTWGFYQLAAHTADENLIVLFRELLKLPTARFYYPDLTLHEGRVARLTDSGPVTLERIVLDQRRNEKQIPDFMRYLNPSIEKVDAAEAINCAKFVHWAERDPEMLATTTRVSIETMKKKLARLDKMYGLTGRRPEVALWVSDMYHQGRAVKDEVEEALALPTLSRQLQALSEIDRTGKYASRCATVRRHVETLLDEKRFEGLEFGKGPFSLAPAPTPAQPQVPQPPAQPPQQQPPPQPQAQPPPQQQPAPQAQPAPQQQPPPQQPGQQQPAVAEGGQQDHPPMV